MRGEVMVKGKTGMKDGGAEKRRWEGGGEIQTRRNGRRRGGSDGRMVRWTGGEGMGRGAQCGDEGGGGEDGRVNLQFLQAVLQSSCRQPRPYLITLSPYLLCVVPPPVSLSLVSMPQLCQYAYQSLGAYRLRLPTPCLSHCLLISPCVHQAPLPTCNNRLTNDPNCSFSLLTAIGLVYTS